MTAVNMIMVLWFECFLIKSRHLNLFWKWEEDHSLCLLACYFFYVPIFPRVDNLIGAFDFGEKWIYRLSSRDTNQGAGNSKKKYLRTHNYCVCAQGKGKATTIWWEKEVRTTCYCTSVLRHYVSVSMWLTIRARIKQPARQAVTLSTHCLLDDMA